MTTRQSKREASLTVERARAVLRYDVATGALTWRERDDVPAWWNARYAGRPVGCVVGVPPDAGYVLFSIDKRVQSAHRVIWLMVTGEWPPCDIDHRDTDRTNNRFSNFRLSIGNQNAANRGATKANKTGLKGVHWHRAAKKFQAQICVNYQRRNLGFFDCPAAAHLRYVIEADKNFGDFARSA